MEEKEFLTGEAALRRLNMRKEQLDALVNEGELRMYRHGGETMFRASDIENLRKKSETDATIVLPSAAAKTGDADEESSEVDIEAVDTDADDSDQTSVLPLDLPEAEVPKASEEGLLSLDADESEAPTVLEEKKKGGITEVMEGLEAIDLDEVAEPARPDAGIDVSSGLLEVIEEDEGKTKRDKLVGAAEAESVTTAETSGLEPSAVEETMGLEPAEASDVGTVPMDVVDTEDSATVALEAVEEDLATAESAAAGSGMGVGAGAMLPIEDIEAEGPLTLIGLLVTGGVLAFAAVVWTGYWFFASENPIIGQFVGLFK